uniref:Acyl-CoA synthetase family member 2, mitochondrial-like n=1 Tax=Saccoglossus kowalevskii TaxID=10224 RepID=A0ABM0GYE3_SACKO
MEKVKLTRSYYHHPSNVQLHGHPIGTVFQQTVNKYREKEALIFPEDNVRITFDDLNKRSNEFAGGLTKLGLQHGDRLGVWSDNHLEWAIVHLAAAKIGLPVVHLQVGFRAHQLVPLLHKTKCTALVMGLASRDLFTEIHEVVPDLKDAKAGELQSTHIPTLRVVINLDAQCHPGTFKFNTILDLGKQLDPGKLLERMNKVEVDDLSAIFFTSGSTGTPKAIVHTHGTQINKYIVLFGSGLVDNHYSKSFMTSPFAHLGGADCGLMFPAISGATVVIGSPKMEASDIIKILIDEQIESLFLLPHLMFDIINFCRTEQLSFPSLKTAYTGGSMMPDRLLKSISEVLKAKVFRVYSSTEAGGVLMHRTDSPLELTISTDGFPSVGCEVKVVDATGRIAPVNVCGELWARNSFLFLYYLGDNEKTQEVKTPDGWYRTGDLAVMNEQSYCRIVGRKTDTIIRAALNIYPAEIENVLIQHPKVKMVQVVPIPDERLHQESGGRRATRARDMCLILTTMAILTNKYEPRRYQALT